MTNIEKLALDIARSDNPKLVLSTLLGILDAVYTDSMTPTQEGKEAQQHDGHREEGRTPDRRDAAND